MKKAIYSISQSITLSVFIGLVVLLFITPQANSIIWTFVIPLVPITLLVIGYSRWRNICPLAWFSKLTQNINLFSRRKLPVWFEKNVYLVQFSLLFMAFTARLYILNNNALLLAGFFIIVIGLVVLSGLFLSGKSWCNYFCPVSVVEKIYSGSNAHMQHVNSACGACTACKTNCPDIDMESSYWKETSNRQKRIVFYAFPGLVFGFYFYYYLEAGSWAYYFDGAWALAGDNDTLISALLLPGFFFLTSIPKMIAVPLTLALTSVVSVYTFRTLENIIRHTKFTEGKEKAVVEHITKSFAAFIAFNVFYIFAGAPTFQHYPYFYAGFHFIIIVVSAVLLWKEIFREEKFFIQERFARKILKKWKGEEVPSKNLKEIYYTYANQQKDHEQHLENYKETILELIIDGILTQESTNLLDKMRDQLGITLQEHKKVMKSLEKENAEFFQENSTMTSEKLFQLKTYKSMLQKILEENNALNENELEQMRKNFQIDIREHENILNQLMNQEGLLKNKVYKEMVELLNLYKINSLIPLDHSLSMNYLKFNLLKELEEHMQSLESIMPLVCSTDNIARLIYLLHLKKSSEQDISWVEESFRPLLYELILYKEKEASNGNSGLNEAAFYIFRDKVNGLIPSLLLVILTEDFGSFFNEEIKYYAQSEESVVSEVANMILTGKHSMSIMHKEALLHAIPLFNTLSPEHIEILAHSVNLKSYAKGDYLVRQGESGDSLYVICKGSAKILIDTPDGEKEVAEVGENDYIGEIAIFSGEKRTASVQTTETVEVLELSVGTLKQVIYYSPGISFDMMRQMTIRLLEQKHP